MRGGLPIVPVHDLAIHPRDNALVVATHGRGFYILDDLAPLQHLAEAKAAEGAYLVPVKSEWLITPDGSRTSGTQATRDYAGANPPMGTTVSYLLKEAAKELKLQIVAQGGEVVRTLDAPSTPGLHHVAWDFRMDAPYSGPAADRPQPQQGFGGFGGGSTSAPVAPGTYTARLTVGGATQERTFAVKKDPLLRLTDAHIAELRDFRMRQLRLNATLSMAIRQSDDLRTQVAQAKAAVAKVNAPVDLTATLDAIDTDLTDVRSKLGAGAVGPGGAATPGAPVPVRTVRQLLSTAAGANRANAMPTQQEKDALALVPSRLDPEVARLNALVSERMPALLKALDEAGVPWTPGRPIRGGL